MTQRELELLLKVFDERWHTLITRYLSDMGDHLADIGQLLPSDVNRIVEMRRMGVNVRRIESQIAHAAQMSEDEIIKIFRRVAQDDARLMERMFGLRRGAALESTGLRAALESQYRVTMGEMKNLSRTTVISDTYREAVDVAVQAVQGGVQDYRKAIRSVIDEAASEGLRVIYPTLTPSGRNRTMRLDSAARQNVLDGARSLHQAALNALGEELGADGVEIDAHMLCAEDHVPYQGRQYTRAQFDELQNRLPRKIGQWNCKHTAYPILMGAPPAYSEAEIAEMAQNSREQIEIDGVKKSRYEWTQEQRKIETAVRYQKDRGVAFRHAGDMEMRRDAQRKINALMERYERISDKAGIGERRERTYVKGYAPVKAKLNSDEKSAIILVSGHEINPRLRKQKQNEHIWGTEAFRRRTEDAKANNKALPSAFFEEVDIEKLVAKNMGKGEAMIDSSGALSEYFSAENNVGFVYLRGSEEYKTTSRVCVKYSKRGWHAYPVKMIKEE